MSRLSVWDLDGTIKPGSLLQDAVKHGIEEGFIDPTLLISPENPGYEDVPIFVDQLRQRSRNDFQQLTDWLSDEARTIAYPWAIQRLEDHAGKYTPILFSHSPDFLVRAFTRGLGFFERASGSYFHTQKLVFSGRANTLDKPKALSRYRRQRNPDEIAFAAGDSMMDAPILLEAREATVVNPPEALAKLALQHGWEIIET